jgi:IS5 family transposase
MPFQPSFSDAEFAAKRKRTRREVFLAEMERVVPWERIEALIRPHYYKNRLGRRAQPLNVMLRIHLLQNWSAYSDQGMEEALYENATLRQFARLNQLEAMPDETTILRFRRLLETHNLGKALFDAVKAQLKEENLMLECGTAVDATLIHAPTSTKNAKRERDPEMHQTKKGNQWYHGMKAHTGVDLDSGLVHTVIATAANVSDISQAAACLHGQEELVFADAGYTGLGKRPEMAEVKAELYIAQRRSVVKALPEDLKEIVKGTEYIKASMRALVEHPYKVLKCEFGYVKARFRGLVKNLNQLHVLFALVNLKKARYAMTGELRPKFA